ncbi:MAG TPA: S8 family serine peptidase [Longimicrobiales bacterium]|nr:S8 family serine peptidase [Longimicrobiales bacterium]
MRTMRPPVRRRAAPALLVMLATAAIPACTGEPVSPPEASAALPEASSSLVQGVDFVEGRLLARFRPGVAEPAVAAAAGASIERDLVLGIRVLSVPAGRELAIAGALSNNPNVEFAEPDLIRTFGNPTFVPVDDPFFGYKWDLDNDGHIYNGSGSVLAMTGAVDADMDWLEAWEQLGAVIGSARIGIIDSGIRADHEELTGRIAAQHDFFAGDTNAADDNGHGTHVAGITAAATNNGKGVSGVAFASDVRFVVAKVCGPTSRGPFSSYGCPLSAIAEGITWAVDNGANVLNISLGGSSGSSAEQSALQYARANNVLPFCAAGNDGGAVSYPAAFPECVAVSATNWSDNLASYSNFGSQIELSAPGGDDEHPNGYSYILSSYNNSSTGYAFAAGTSMASPQAAGLGALLHALGITDDDAKLTRMINSADDLGAAGRDNLFGHGRINVFNAVNGLGGGGDDGGGGNTAPASSFTFSCTDLSCDFTDTSTDADGNSTITSRSWTFGDGNSSNQQNPSHSYVAAGTYTVSLTVTDNENASDTSSQQVTVSEPPSGGFTLSATGYKVRGLPKADLTWSGASSTNVDVYRNGALIATTPNGGAFTDNIDQRGGGSYVYRVCEAGTSTCSNDVTVTF